jgi:hypothetical protein
MKHGHQCQVQKNYPANKYEYRKILPLATFVLPAKAFGSLRTSTKPKVAPVKDPH